MKPTVLALVLAAALSAASLPGAVIGTNPPSLPLTPTRIADLIADTRPQWTAYLEKSKSQMQRDRAFLVAEIKAHGLKESVEAPSGHDARSVPLNKAASWYGEAEAKRIADIVVSFQTPAGGWSKNIDLAQHIRQPGERYSHDGGSKFMDASDNDKPSDVGWSYIGTFDNDATITELRFLAKLISALSAENAANYRAAFDRGLTYILAAQYPNGGWPQVWPLEGGYHDAITFNDGADIHILTFQRDVAQGQNEFAFVSPDQRKQASNSYILGLRCLLECQVTIEGQKTIWAQQNDMLTLAPCSARNYEMPSQSSSESADIVLFLMEISHPTPEVKAAVKSAASWMEKNAIHGFAYKMVSGEGRHLVAANGGPALWARYYEMGTNRPLFGDRDKSIHDKLEEISLERRNGYQWFNDRPQHALDEYQKWVKKSGA